MDCEGWLVLLCDMESGVVDLLVCDLLVFLVLVVEIFIVCFYVYFDDVLLEEWCI